MKLDLPIKNLLKHISLLAQKEPQKLALLKCNKEGLTEESINYEQLYNEIENIASWFLSKGLSSGDVVGLAMYNSPQLLILSWTAWSLGIITVPLDVKRDTLENYFYKIKLSKAKFLITQKEILTKEEKDKLSKAVTLVELDNIKKVKKVKDINWKNDISHQALILFTSGTTMHPKGVQLSLENLVINAEGIKKWFKIEAKDRFMVNLPLHHINSTTFCLATLLAGGSIAIVPTYSNSEFWHQAALTESTFTSIVPSICFDQLSRINEFDMVKNKLRLNRIQIGSAPVVVSDVKEFIKLFGIPIYQGYGQTETALRVTGVPLDLEEEIYNQLVETNSIGSSMNWATVSVVDDKKGKPLKDNEEGEIAVKGPAVMKGYLDKVDAFKNGYFMTGDIGYSQIIKGNKYFFLKGRKKEIIIKGGINISPVAVEDGLKRVSEDIDQVYVVGFPDRRYGEEVAAVISWKDVDILKAKTKLKYQLSKGTDIISLYETPQYITTIDPKDLPVTSTGKVQRSVIKGNISLDAFESIYMIFKTPYHQFIKLTPNSLYIKEAFNLYNYCWDPLTLSFNEFKIGLGTQDVIIAVNKDNKVEGLVSLIRTNVPKENLCLTSYSKLIDPLEKEVKNINGKEIICVSICSSNYKKRETPNLTSKPPLGEVKKYLEEGLDNVYNFHLKSKGGFKKGADLVCLIPKGRPEDKSSLGFNMLLKYPKIDQDIKINLEASVASQLIEVVMFLARQIGIENVYAFSRPAGLANYISQKN